MLTNHRMMTCSLVCTTVLMWTFNGVKHYYVRVASAYIFCVWAKYTQKSSQCNVPIQYNNRLQSCDKKPHPC